MFSARSVHLRGLLSRTDVRVGWHSLTLYSLGGAFRTYAGKPRSNPRSKKKATKSKKVTFPIPNHINVNNFANMLNKSLDRMLVDLKALGFQKITSEYILSREYIELILQEYNYELPTSLDGAKTSKNVYDELKVRANPKNLAPRAPVVAIMGHVDHGKTTILDYLRKSSIVSQEHGGITQHIGAFQVVTPISQRKITFLDTPGHAAFLKMRERGANITDIVILVVSAEDSVMPQTVEAIRHVKSSGTEIIVAITKVDKLGSTKNQETSLNKVMNDLMVHEIHPEQLGGDVQVVPISAKTGSNMDLLEESIIALSDSMDVSAEKGPKTMFEGWILESELKKTHGSVATVLVRKGELRNGKILLSGSSFCKVRAMFDEHGKPVTLAGPSQAVEVTGWKGFPSAGDEVLQVATEAIAKKYIAKRNALIQAEHDVATVEKMNKTRMENSLEQIEEEEESTQEDTAAKGPKKINFIVKADVSGSAEAIVESISSLGNAEVHCNIVDVSVGAPTENDINLAKVSASKILCFNLDNMPNDILKNKAGVDVRQYNVIYKLIEDVTEILVSNLAPIYETKVMATVEIREIFNFKMKQKNIRIAGCRVTNGKIARNSTVKIVRGPEEKVIYDGKLATLKQGKETANEITKGNDCGVTFENNFEAYEAGDKMIVYEKVRIPRSL